MQFILLLVLLSIHTNYVWGQTLTIKSRVNEAELYLVGEKDSLTRIGTLPYTVPISEFQSAYGQSGPYMLKITKKGHETFHLLVSSLSGKDLTFDVNLRPDNEFQTMEKSDRLITQLFNVQHLLKLNNTEDALKKLSELEKDFPLSSSVHEFMAMAYYLKKDFEKSLGYYQKASSLNPTNQDAVKMKMYLEAKLGLEKK